MRTREDCGYGEEILTQKFVDSGNFGAIILSSRQWNLCSRCIAVTTDGRDWHKMRWAFPMVVKVSGNTDILYFVLSKWNVLMKSTYSSKTDTNRSRRILIEKTYSVVLTLTEENAPLSPLFISLALISNSFARPDEIKRNEWIKNRDTARRLTTVPTITKQKIYIVIDCRYAFAHVTSSLKSQWNMIN